MKYTATLSTNHSTGTVDSTIKQEILDVLEAWLLQYDMDARDSMLVPTFVNGKNSTHWEKGNIAISCNFEVKF